VTPGPEEIEFPALIDLPRAKLRAYPVETVIAEKALGMVERGLLNSRMKDYFDLRYLSRTRSFEAEGLAQALSATASRRKISIPAGPVAGLSAAFAMDLTKQTQWQAFCRRLRSDQPADTLRTVVGELAAFLGPVFQSVTDGQHAAGRWTPGGPWH